MTIPAIRSDTCRCTHRNAVDDRLVRLAVVLVENESTALSSGMNAGREGCIASGLVHVFREGIHVRNDLVNERVCAR